jgi:hypothetical protein
MDNTLFYILIAINLYYVYDLYTIGGIIFRKNAKGDSIFSPLSILSMLKAPLTIKEFWTTKLIFSNYYFLLLIGVIMHIILNKINHKFYSMCFNKLSS